MGLAKSSGHMSGVKNKVWRAFMRAAKGSINNPSCTYTVSEMPVCPCSFSMPAWSQAADQMSTHFFVVSGRGRSSLMLRCICPPTAALTIDRWTTNSVRSLPTRATSTPSV